MAWTKTFHNDKSKIPTFLEKIKLDSKSNLKKRKFNDRFTKTTFKPKLLE